MSKIIIKNTEFYYELHGEGEPVVLISGYTCDSQFYIPLVELLKLHFQVLIFDNRAIGQTKDNGKKLSVEIMAQDVIDLCDSLKLKKPHIIGQSMGGTIAQTIAANYPEKINKLALLATTSKWRKAMLQGLGSILALGKAGCCFDLIFQASLPWIFGEKFLSSPQNIEDLKKSLLSNPYMQTLADQSRQYHILETFDGRSALAKIKSETLIVYGDEDLLSLPSDSHYMAEHIKNSKIKAIGCAHDIPHEATQELSETLLDFLA